MRQVGMFFGGVFVIDGIMMLVIPGPGGSSDFKSVGMTLLLVGLFFSAVSTGVLVKYREQSWISYIWGFVWAPLVSSLYAFAWIISLMAGGSPRRSVSSMVDKRAMNAKRRYDASGKFVGTTTADGNRFDSNGRFQGTIDEDGNIFDESGALQGSVSEHMHFGRNGEFEGSISDDGQIFDKHGRFIGSSIDA